MEFHGNGNGTETVLTQLQKEGVSFRADCGGNGRCGKCKVQFLKRGTEQLPEPTEEERKLLGEQALSEGFRLACKAVMTGDYVIRFDAVEEEIAAETMGCEETCASEPSSTEKRAIIAIDLGTTTLAGAYVSGGKVLRIASAVNHQRSFGADIISRIQASNEGNGEALRQLIETDLRKLTEELGADPDITYTVISGNTTMQHLLRGLSCKGLGISPFTPVDISLCTEGNRVYLPGISTFVGADIVSGIVTLGMDQSEEISLFIDLGTNGEMALGNRQRILTAGTAAGPAFEGGNLSCGVASIPGAIQAVSLMGRKPILKTIGGKEPMGLCGSGVIELLYELLKNRLLDKNGCLDTDYEDTGFPLADKVTFTNHDVHEVQLAKAAIRAGEEALMDAYGIAMDEIQHLYLAGGFGQGLSLQKAAGIGLLPEDLLPKAEAVGNTSLKGAVLFASDAGVKKRFLHTVAISEELSLAGNPRFQELYLQYLSF